MGDALKGAFDRRARARNTETSGLSLRFIGASALIGALMAASTIRVFDTWLRRER
ncbi:MAG: hypothetical protein HOP03_11890 [Lysobacter sp.]|nr:hypothetical protein [Lysobacter sp.]